MRYSSWVEIMQACQGTAKGDEDGGELLGVEVLFEIEVMAGLRNFMG